MKTSELTGAALDWAVVKADGVEDIDFVWPRLRNYSPSTDWAQGGPIIEREKIDVDYWPDGGYWQATSDTYDSFGPTPLIAAMRCFVASRLGDEVDIPEELV